MRAGRAAPAVERGLPGAPLPCAHQAPAVEGDGLAGRGPGHRLQVKPPWARLEGCGASGRSSRSSGSTAPVGCLLRGPRPPHTCLTPTTRRPATTRLMCRRGAGFISLQALAWMAAARPATFAELMGKQRGVRAAWEYPFAAVGCGGGGRRVWAWAWHEARARCQPVAWPDGQASARRLRTGLHNGLAHPFALAVRVACRAA